MKGHIRRRGERSWELKFDTDPDPLTGKRITKYRSLRGTRKEAETELARLIVSIADGAYTDPSKVTLGEFLDRWETWAATQVSAKTLERYKELARHHVRPHLGTARLQRLKTVNFAELYGKLQSPKPGGAGLAPRTVGHIHRLLHRIFSQAQKWDLLTNNSVALAEPPAVAQTEIEILTPEEIKDILDALRSPPPKPGRNSEPHRLYMAAVIGLATGMRRGEIVALRWSDIDLEAGKIRVDRSLEQTDAGLAFKAPKTKAGRRTITVPLSVVTELRRHWRQQQEQRLMLGLGKGGSDELVLALPDTAPWPPDSLTTAWAKTVASLKLPKVTLHALRHTHASQLIAAGVDVVTVSRRLGHSKPSVTLNVYAHLFDNPDERASEVVEEALAKALAPAT
jgi:integrase